MLRLFVAWLQIIFYTFKYLVNETPLVWNPWVLGICFFQAENKKVTDSMRWNDLHEEDRLSVFS